MTALRRDDDRVIREWLTEPTWLPPSDTERIARLVRQTHQVRGWRTWLPARPRGPVGFTPIVLVVVLLLAGVAGLVAVLGSPADTDPLTGLEVAGTGIPGVVRVVGDGSRDLDDDVFSAAVSDDGAVWVERHAADWTDHRLERLGDADATVPLDTHASVVRSSGGLVATGHETSLALTADGWVERPGPSCAAIAHDGACWEPGRDGRGLRRTTADGTTRLTPADLGLDQADDFGFHLAARPGGGLMTEVTLGGRVRSEGARIDAVAILADDEWDVVELGPSAVGDRRIRISELGVSPLDGAIWTYHLLDRGELVARRFVDGETTSFGPIEITDQQQYGILFGDDGSVWLGSMARVHRSRVAAVTLPDLPDAQGRTQADLSLGPGGTAWVSVHDQPPTRSTGLIVIRPDAFTDE